MSTSPNLLVVTSTWSLMSSYWYRAHNLCQRRSLVWKSGFRRFGETRSKLLMPSTSRVSLNKQPGTISWISKLGILTLQLKFILSEIHWDTSCLRCRKPIPLQYLSLASWTAFVYWSLSSLLLNLWGLLWLASVSALMCVVCKYTEGLPELEVLFDKHGTVKTLTTGAFFKRVEQKKKKNIWEYKKFEMNMYKSLIMEPCIFAQSQATHSLNWRIIWHSRGEGQKT